MKTKKVKTKKSIKKIKVGGKPVRIRFNTKARTKPAAMFLTSKIKSKSLKEGSEQWQDSSECYISIKTTKVAYRKKKQHFRVQIRFGNRKYWI